MTQNLPIQLPNGWTLVPPAPAGGSGMAPSDPLSALLPLVTSAAGAANPQLNMILAVIGVLFQLGHALKNQMQNVPTGANPQLEQFEQMFWQTVLGAFAVKPVPPPAAG